MRALILSYLRDLRANYWFVPSVMAIGAIAASFVMSWVDGYVGASWLRDLDWVFVNKPDGARAVLSTIAGSMITVAGVTFSMTIVAVSFTAGQIGPRLLGNFMRDRTNQFTLGTYVATFLYCLLVLRSVRSATEAQTAQNTYEAFVPHLSIMLALVLVVFNVAVLIAFFHHVPESINVSNLVAGVGRDLNDMIEKRFPTRIGEAPAAERQLDAEAAMPADFFASARPVAATSSGYVKVVDETAIMRVAVDHDLLIRMEFRPGDFVVTGQTVLYANNTDRGEAIADEALAQLQGVYVVGAERTRHQNILFLIDELVEIIARALSPGINDPFTAIACIDWLQSALMNLAQRDTPAAVRVDEKGTPRIIAHPMSFATAASAVFDQLLPYVAADRNAALHLMKMIAEVAASTPDADHQRVLLDHALHLRDAADESLPLKIDRETVTHRYETLCRLIRDGQLRHQLRDDQGWFGGTA